MHKKIFYTLVCIVASNLNFSQTKNTIEEKEKITSFFTSYFALDRESIHLHLNKTVFITPERVWFKGYVINRKTRQPSLKTTNVYADFYDQKGNKLAHKLLFCSKGNFAGFFDLGENLESGEYYIHTYTNWMNNFTEDESYNTKIKVINPAQGNWEPNKNITHNGITIDFYPEGTHFVEDISNSVVVKVKDCAGNYLQNSQGEIVDQNGQVLKAVDFSQFGCGKFEITPNRNTLYFRCNVNGKKIESTLPTPVEIGFGLSVNNYVFKNKTVIKISANPKTVQSFDNQQFYIAINQDDKVVIHDFKISKEKLFYEFVFANEHLFDGINTIQILDDNLNLQAERIIYSFSETSVNSKVMHNVSNGNLSNYVGYTDLKEGNLSICIIPDGSKSQELSQSILYDLTCKPYILEPIDHFNDFVLETNRAKSFELDLLLISQKKSKYSWDLIKSEPPTEKFSFDAGIKVTGKINTELKNTNQYKAKIFSVSEGVLATTDINDKNEFEFDHLILKQSADVALLTLKMPDLSPIESYIIAQTNSKNKSFIKGFKIPEICNIEKQIIPFSIDDLPTVKSNSVLLKEVEIEKSPYKYKNIFGNRNLTAVKIDASYANRNLLSFISSYGFKVSRNFRGNLTISSLKKFSLMDANENTSIFIDGFELYDNDELDIYTMNDIDEIYLDNSYFSSHNGRYGIIKIYLKKKFSNAYQKNTNTNFKVDGGFEPFIPYEGTKYQNFENPSFKKYGIIQFIQYTLIDENGSYFMQIPNTYKGKVKIIIEGITNEGKLIFEEKVMKLE